MNSSSEANSESLRDSVTGYNDIIQTLHVSQTHDVTASTAGN